MKTWRVYKITAKDGRGYIGITVRSLEHRWRQHMSSVTTGTGYALHNAIQKHGPDFFKIEEIATCVSAEEAAVCERAQIAQHGTFARTSNGFNLTLGGDGNWGWSPTEETRDKMRAKGRARTLDPEWKRKLDEGKRRSTKIGKFIRTPETLARMAEARKGRKLSPEHVEKLRALSTGRVKSEAARAKLKENWAARKAAGWRPSDETRAKISASKKGVPMSPEGKAAHAAAGLLRRGVKKGPMSPEMRGQVVGGRRRWLQTPEGQAYLVGLAERGREQAKKNIGRLHTPEVKAKLAAMLTERNKRGMAPESKAKRAATMQRLLSDPEYRAKVWTPERKAAHAAQLRKNAEKKRLIKALALALASENRLLAEGRFTCPLVEA